MLAALHRAGARLLRRVPDRREPIRPPCRASPGTCRTSAGGSPRAGRRRAPPSCASTSTKPGAPQWTRPAGRSCHVAGERAEATWVHDPGEPRALDARQPVRRAVRVPGRARGRVARRRAHVHDAGVRGRAVTLAGRVVAHLEVSTRRALAVPPRQARRRPRGRPRPRAAVRSAGRRRAAAARDDRGLPRPYGLSRAARAPAATARRLERLPRVPPPPRHCRESVGRDDTQTNRQTLATGGATPSYVSLTVVAGR